jgi:hypothetical protein
MSDPYAPLKDNAWQEIAEIDARLEPGEIDEAGWHAEIARLIVPAYLAAETPGSRRIGSPTCGPAWSTCHAIGAGSWWSGCSAGVSG